MEKPVWCHYGWWKRYNNFKYCEKSYATHGCNHLLRKSNHILVVCYRQKSYADSERRNTEWPLEKKYKNLRKEAGLSQEELSYQLGVSRQAISKWERDSGYPETEKIVRMSKLFNVSLDYLLNEEDTEKPEISPDEKGIYDFCSEWRYSRLSKRILWIKNSG